MEFVPTTDIIFLAILIFAAAVVRGYAGFGFSAIAIIAASIFITPSELVPMLYILEIVASIHMIRSVISSVDTRLLGYVLLGCAVSLPVGQYLLLALPANLTRLFIYFSVLICALLVWKGYRIHTPMTNKLGVISGMLIGFGSGLGSVGGLLAIVIFLGVRYDSEKTRAIFVATFFGLYIFGTMITYSNGLLDKVVLTRVAWLVLPLLVGLLVGERFFRQSSSHTYRQFALGLMIVLSILGIFRTIFL